MPVSPMPSCNLWMTESTACPPDAQAFSTASMGLPSSPGVLAIKPASRPCLLGGTGGSENRFVSNGGIVLFCFSWPQKLGSFRLFGFRDKLGMMGDELFFGQAIINLRPQDMAWMGRRVRD